MRGLRSSVAVPVPAHRCSLCSWLGQNSAQGSWHWIPTMLGSAGSRDLTDEPKLDSSWWPVALGPYFERILSPVSCTPQTWQWISAEHFWGFQCSLIFWKMHFWKIASQTMLLETDSGTWVRWPQSGSGFRTCVKDCFNSSLYRF